LRTPSPTRACVLEGQTHDIDPQVLTPVLEEFLAD